MTESSRRSAPGTNAGNGIGNGSRAAAPWWTARGSGRRVPFADADDGGSVNEPPPVGNARAFTPAMVPLIVLAGVVLAVIMANAHFSQSAIVA